MAGGQGPGAVRYGGLGTGLGAEAAVPVAVRAQGPQEVDVAELRPVGVAEVELAVRALPEQEAGQPLLARGADQQVGVGLALGVEVLGDVLDVEEGGDLFEAGALGGVLGRAGCVRRRRSRAGRRSPTATLTSSMRAGRSAVASSADLSAAAVDSGSRSSEPNARTRQRRRDGEVGRRPPR